MSPTFDTLVALAAPCLGGKSGIYLAPSIPPRKEKNARAVHAAWLPPGEPIAVLFDDTAFGAADDGYVVTAERICWRNFGEDPVMLRWSEVTEIALTDPVLNGKRIKTQMGKDETLAASLQLFRALATAATTTGNAALRALAEQPCRMCGCEEHLYFTDLVLTAGAPLPFEALVCSSCRYTHLFNVQMPLETKRTNVQSVRSQVLKATTRGPYR